MPSVFSESVFLSKLNLMQIRRSHITLLKQRVLRAGVDSKFVIGRTFLTFNGMKRDYFGTEFLIEVQFY